MGILTHTSRRLVSIAIALALVASGCSGRSQAPDAPGREDTMNVDGTPIAGGDFASLNGWVWFYTTATGTRFDEIEALLPDLHGDGIRVIGIYSPYHGDPEKWLGCAPLDFYATSPDSGTIEDFEAMTEAAHELGMKVVTYFVNIYIDSRSEFFQTAERQYREGDRESREVSAFQWSETGTDPLPEPAAGPSEWAFSDVADAYYWSLWGEAGFDHNLTAAKGELRRVEAFWLDRGVDGFMWDAAYVDPVFQEMMVEFPISHAGRDLWITFESTAGVEADGYHEFGLTSWFNYEDDDSANDYTRIVTGEIDLDELEAAFELADTARGHERLTYAWSPWGLPKYEDNSRMLPQEAALLTGAGIAYGAPNYTAQRGWPDVALDAWADVMRMVNETPALHPASARERVPVIDNQRAFAMARSNGDQQVLAVYNFEPDPTTVTVDLDEIDVGSAGSGEDLLSGERLDDLSGQVDIEVDGFGFRFIELQAGP